MQGGSLQRLAFTRFIPTLAVAFCGWLAIVPSLGVAQVTTTTTLTSSANPSVINQTFTLTAKVDGALYAAPFPAGVGRVAGVGEYLRYELTGSAFGRAVVSGDLTNLTTPAAFANVVIALAGNVGDTYVVLQITAGGVGISSSETVRFNFAPNIITATSSVKYSVHDTLSSAAGVVANNSTLVFGPQSALISTLSPPFALTGNVNFSRNGVSIAGCASVALTNAAASCSTVIVTAGNYAMTANYSGNINYAFSTGTLAGGQSVGLGVSPTTVSGANVGQAFSQVFTGSGGTAPYLFTASSGVIPPGLTLSSGGTLSGVPTAAGTFNFFVSTTDSGGGSGTVGITMAVAKGNQSITFNPPVNVVLGGSYVLTATASSGLPVSYAVGSPAICTLAGNALNFIAAGACIVTPMQSGDANYFAAPSTPRTINVIIAGGVKPLRLRSAATGQSLTGDLAGNVLQFATVPDPGVQFRVMGLVDLDGNKVQDLIFQNISQGDAGDVRVWKDVDSSFDRLLRSARLAWRLDASGDLDGDGLGDLVWRFTGTTANVADTGVSYIWFTDGNGVSQVRKRGGAPLDWTLLGAIDVNRDGAADMIYISPTREIRILMATPGRTCANLSAGFVPTGFTALKVGTFIRTGRAEMLIRNSTTGEVQLIVLDGTGLALPAATGDPNDPNAACTSSTLSVLNTPIRFANTDPSWQFFGTADFNGDGFLDIVWKRPDSSMTVWLTAGDNLPLSGINNAGIIPAGYAPVQP